MYLAVDMYVVIPHGESEANGVSWFERFFFSVRVVPNLPRVYIYIYIYIYIDVSGTCKSVTPQPILMRSFAVGVFLERLGAWPKKFSKFDHWSSGGQQNMVFWAFFNCSFVRN